MPASLRRDGEVGGLCEAIGEIGFIQAFVQADCHRVEVAACKSAVGGEAFAQDQFVLDILEKRLIVHAQQAADVDDGILLGGHAHAVGEGEHFVCDLFDGFILIARFPLFDEEAVFGVACRVDEERDSATRGRHPQPL